MAMFKKTGHWVALILVVVGALYVFHMFCNHQGQGILPNFGALGSK